MKPLPTFLRLSKSESEKHAYANLARGVRLVIRMREALRSDVLLVAFDAHC